MPKQTQTNPISKAKKCCWPLLTGFGGRFLLTKQAFFYRMDVLETNTYNGLLFKLCWKYRGLSRLYGFCTLGCQIRYWRSGPAELILCFFTDQPDYCRTPKINFLEKVQC
jgi:hypothetical protein